MLDYIKSLVRKKPDTIMIHTGTNDVTNVVKTVNNVKKVAQYIREDDGDQKIQIGLSSICQRADRDLEKEITDTNKKLKNYCSGKGFIFVNNSTVNQSCLNKSKLHLNKKGTILLTNNIKQSLKEVF